MEGPHGRNPIQTQRGKSGVKDARRVGENRAVEGAGDAMARSGVKGIPTCSSKCSRLRNKSVALTETSNSRTY